MVRKIILPILAVIGFIIGLRTVMASNRPVPPAMPVVDPAQPSFAEYVAGVGIVEANTENIGIAAQASGVIMGVDVKAGQTVKAGDMLFHLDSRESEAQLAIKVSAVQVAKTALAEAQHELSLWEKVADSRAVSIDELSKKRYAAQMREAELKRAEAEANAARTQLSLLEVRAPVDGQILQLNARPGEFAPAQALSTPLILMGNITPLHLRIDVDENDAWRVPLGAPAEALVRGNADLRYPLEFVRVEPYVAPKKSLSGDSTERVDTRVLRLVYRFTNSPKQIFVGQLMDVFIKANRSAESAKTNPEPSEAAK